MPLCVETEHAPREQPARQPDQSWNGMSEQHFMAKEGGDELLSQVDPENVQPPDIP
jgi:hypothetical protein